MVTQAKSSSGLAFLPVMLTASALLIAAGIAFFFGLGIAALCATPLPVALLLLWVGRDVEAPIDRIEAVDAERARTTVRPAPAAAALDRAA